MKKVFLTLTALTLCALTAQAQTQRPANATGAQASGNGVLPLPDPIDRVVGLDATNVVLAQTHPTDTEPSSMHVIKIKHVYAGGIAMLFGGSTIPTAPFVSPAP